MLVDALNEAIGVFPQESLACFLRDGRLDIVAGRVGLARVPISDRFDLLNPRSQQTRENVASCGRGTNSVVTVEVGTPAFEPGNERHPMRAQIMLIRRFAPAPAAKTALELRWAGTEPGLGRTGALVGEAAVAARATGGFGAAFHIGGVVGAEVRVDAFAGAFALRGWEADSWGAVGGARAIDFGEGDAAKEEGVKKGLKKWHFERQL